MSTNGEFKIQKGVPMPKAHWGRPMVYPWDEMEVGDMFFVPVNGKTPEQIQYTLTSCRTVAHRRSTGQRKFATRRIEQDGVAGVGVWRIA